MYFVISALTFWLWMTLVKMFLVWWLSLLGIEDVQMTRDVFRGFRSSATHPATFLASALGGPIDSPAFSPLSDVFDSLLRMLKSVSVSASLTHWQKQRRAEKFERCPSSLWAASTTEGHPKMLTVDQFGLDKTVR